MSTLHDLLHDLVETAFPGHPEDVREGYHQAIDDHFPVQSEGEPEPALPEPEDKGGK